jgi:hypothetical protein
MSLTQGDVPEMSDAPIRSVTSVSTELCDNQNLF